MPLSIDQVSVSFLVTAFGLPKLDIKFIPMYKLYQLKLIRCNYESDDCESIKYSVVSLNSFRLSECFSMEHVHLGDFGRQAVSCLLGQSRHNYFTKKNSTHPLTFMSWDDRIG